MATGDSHYLWKKYRVCFLAFILVRNVTLHDLYLCWCHPSSSTNTRARTQKYLTALEKCIKTQQLGKNSFLLFTLITKEPKTPHPPGFREFFRHSADEPCLS